MASESFRIEFDRNRSLQQALFRYTYALMAQISQTDACNRFHDAEARLARWLLMTRDRVGSNEFPLTHEFLAHMLGLSRAGVTQAATALKRRRLIGYHRGAIQILDVKGLEASCCSCYQIVNAVYERAQVQVTTKVRNKLPLPSGGRVDEQGIKPRRFLRKSPLR